MTLRNSLPGWCFALSFGLLTFLPSAYADDKPRWIRVSSAHFSVLTDAPEKKGREVAVRFEQMRAAFGQMLSRSKLQMSEPLEIIAFASDEGYQRAAPVRQGRLTAQPGFFLPGEDRDYVVLNLATVDSWRAVSHSYVHQLLNYNYPPTQPWFDEGFSEYFSSLRLDNKQMQIGGEPVGGDPVQEDAGEANPLRSVLATSTWMPLPDLFTFRPATNSAPPATFYAQSWMAMHYLIQKNKLSETGSYFEMVQVQKLPVLEAIQKAYGMSAVQLDQEIKDYFHSIAPTLPTQNNIMPSGPAPSDGDNIGTSTQYIPEFEARALVAEMMLRLPEHREAGIRDLQALIAGPKGENAIEHRALAWPHLLKNEFGQAQEELEQALDLDKNDPWTHYYMALAKYRVSQTSGQPIQGLPNMMQDLRWVIDWNTEFAEAYNMLAMARLQGGGVHSAMEAVRLAIQLSPRNESYLLNLATIYIAGKSWDSATALLQHLQSSSDFHVAQAAHQDLDDLPTLKKYGVLPVRVPQATKGQSSPKAAPKSTQAKIPPLTADSESDEDESEPAAHAEPPDRRPIKFLKARLLNVDCTQAPAAILIVSAGKTMKLRTADYKSLPVIGASMFSCGWKNLSVSVNYKPGGKNDGDLVSLEVQ